MGSQLARGAYVAQGSRLSRPAIQLLVWMSLYARDEDAHPVYYAGRDTLAIGLGYTGADYSPAQLRTIRTRVRRYLRELREAGCVTPTLEAGPGIRQRYILNVWASGPVDNSASVPEWGASPTPHMGGLSDPPMGGLSDPPMGGLSGPPYPSHPIHPDSHPHPPHSVSTALRAREPVDNPRAPQRAPVPVDLEGDVTLCGRGHGQLEPSCLECLEVGGMG